MIEEEEASLTRLHIFIRHPLNLLGRHEQEILAVRQLVREEDRHLFCCFWGGWTTTANVCDTRGAIGADLGVGFVWGVWDGLDGKGFLWSWWMRWGLKIGKWKRGCCSCHFLGGGGGRRFTDLRFGGDFVF